jgi:hypothetical protein
MALYSLLYYLRTGFTLGVEDILVTESANDERTAIMVKTRYHITTQYIIVL